MIDFDAAVLVTTMNTFAINVRFTLTASKPEAAPFDGRGVYSSEPYDVIMQDGAIFGDQKTSLGIRLKDFTGPVPDRLDEVEIIDTRHPAFGNKYIIADSDLDGQGGAMLMLRTKEPPA